MIAALVLMLVVVFLNSSRLLPSSAFGWLSDWFRRPFRRRMAVARFARYLADLLEAGVSTPDALRIAGFTVNQSRMRRAAWKLADDIESTGLVSQQAYRRPLTATVLHALAPEVAPASRVRLLRDISACHAERVRTGLSWTSGIVEPIAICLVGLIVGSVVIALFLPLVKLVEGLSS
jgi:type IV pilus assembly protein PilC